MSALERLLTVLAEFPSAIVAYSGGVDSATVAAAARRALGDRMLAITSASESVSQSELSNAHQVAAELDLPHRVIRTQELDNPDYVRNGPDRCFHCKSTLYGDLTEIARREGFAVVLNGTHVDDLGDHRPGLEAALQYGVRSPLLESRLTKAEVREIAHELGVSAWDRPATACLASRLPHGMGVTVERLNQVERAERSIAQLGFSGHRVRHHGDIGRLELAPAQIDQAILLRDAIASALRDAGFRYAVLDLDGYRPGSLNPLNSPTAIPLPVIG